MRDLIIDKDEMKIICSKNIALVLIDICFNSARDLSIINNKNGTIMEYRYKRVIFNIIVDEKGVKYKVHLNNKSIEKRFMRFHVKNIISESFINTLKRKIERMVYSVQLDDLFKYENAQELCDDFEDILKPRGEYEKA